ncbi:MAG: LptA/OstA family protein [Pseudomonadota bacterium]
MVSRMRLPLNFCHAWYYSFILFLIIILFSPGVFADGDASLGAESGKKIHIIADSLVSDSNAKYAEFIGKVEATQGEFVIKSDKLKIFYKGKAKDKAASGTDEAIEKIVATGNVNIKSKDMTAVTKEAEYNSDTMILTLRGEGSKVVEQKNFITGSKIIVYRKEGKTKVEGDKNKRVTAVFYPREKNELTNQEKKPKTEISESIPGAAKEIEPKKQELFPEKTADMEKENPLLKEAVIEPEPLNQQNAGLSIPVEPVAANIPVVEDNAKPEEAAEKTTPGRLNKFMGVTIFEDKTVYGSMGFEKTFSKELVQNIKKNCPDLLFLKTGNKNYPSTFVELPRLASGSIAPYKLCEAGRQLGLTSILTGSVIDIIVTDDFRGIWFWKKTVPEISMTVRIELFDTETGTKLFDENYTYKADSDKAGSELVKSGKLDAVFLKMALKHYMSLSVSSICNIMNEQKWKGFILSVSDNKATISSGRNLGLVSGKIFEVFGNSVISGVENQKFVVPGLKIGEVKITNVFDNSSEAVIISGSALKEGYSIRPK